VTTSAKHVAVVRAKLKFTTREEFIQGFMPLIGRAGLFIRTKNPKEVGTVVRFEFKLADDTAIFVGEGAVRKQILPTPGASATPSGMIVALKRMNRASKEVLDEIVRRRVADQLSESPTLHHSTATPPAAVAAVEPDEFEAELPEPEPVFAAAVETSRPQSGPAPAPEPRLGAEPEPKLEHNPELAVEPENPFADLDIDRALGGGGGLFGDGLESELDDIFAEAGMFSSDTDGFDFSAPADLGGSALPMINAGNVFEDPEPQEEEEEYRGGVIEMDESEFDDDDDEGDLFSPTAPKPAKPVAPRVSAPVLLAPPKPLAPPVLAPPVFPTPLPTFAPTPLPTPLPTFAPTPLPTPLPTFAPAAPVDDGLDDLLLAPEPEPEPQAAPEPEGSGFDDFLVAPEPGPEPEPDSGFDGFLVAPEPEPEPDSGFDGFLVAPEPEPKSGVDDLSVELGREPEPEYEAAEFDEIPDARLPPPRPSHELDDVLHHLDDDEQMTNEGAGLAEATILSEPRIPIQHFASRVDDDDVGLNSLVSHAKQVDVPKIELPRVELNPLDAVSINNADLPPPPKPTGFKSPSIDDLQAGKPRKKGLFNKLFGKE